MTFEPAQSVRSSPVAATIASNDALDVERERRRCCELALRKVESIRVLRVKAFVQNGFAHPSRKVVQHSPNYVPWANWAQ